MYTLQALVFLSNQGKTNKTGRRDQQAAFRHRLPELCCIGGLGFYLFSLFHVLGNPLPDFSGEIGSRSWYKLLLFPGSGGEDEEMTYQSERMVSFLLNNCRILMGCTADHRKWVNLMHIRNDIMISKSTHAGRPFAAVTAWEHRATQDDMRTLGN